MSSSTGRKKRSHRSRDKKSASASSSSNKLSTSTGSKPGAFLTTGSLGNIQFTAEELFAIFKLIFSASKGDIAGIAEALKETDVNMGDYDRRTALHLAASEGRTKAAQFLIEQGAAVNAEDRWGGTPLQDAIAHKHDEVANLLRQNGAKILNTAVLADKLCLASSAGDLPTVKRLIENGADVSVPDYDGRTALHIAASEGRIFVVEELTKAGAPVNATDRWGGTPLMDAINHKHDAVAKYLSSNGAKLVNEKEIGSALCNAASTGNLAVLKRIIAAGGDPKMVSDYDKRTPLHLAAAGGYIGVVEYLVEVGCPLNAQDRWKGTPLQDAMRHNHDDVAALLKSKGALVVESSSVETQVSSKYLVSAASNDAGAPSLSADQLGTMSMGDLVKSLVSALKYPDALHTVLEAVFRAVSVNDDDNQAKNGFMFGEGGDIVCSIIQSYPKVEKLLSVSANIIEELALVDRHSVALTKFGATRLLLNLLQTSESSRVHETALSALSSLSFVQPKAADAELIASGFSENNAINILLAAIRRVQSNPVAVKRALQTLWHACALDQSNIDRLALNSGIDSVAHFWKEYRSKSDVTHAALGAAILAVHHGSAAEAFVEHLGGVQLTIDTIRQHNDDEEIVQMALHLLAELTTKYRKDAKSPTAARGISMPKIFVEKKGAQTIISTMKKYKQNVALNEYAANSLMHMAKAAAEEKLNSPVLEKHGAKAVSSAAKRHRHSDQLVLIDRELKMMKGCIIM